MSVSQRFRLRAGVLHTSLTYLPVARNPNAQERNLNAHSAPAWAKNVFIETRTLLVTVLQLMLRAIRQDWYAIG